MKIKTGIGIDVHRLEAGREFWLGGIKIGHEKGCVAHSDGDVLIHAICDALLGATGLGDIGQHFPDTCPAYKGIDSKLLLQKTKALIDHRGYAISNIDSVVCLQRPKIRPFIDDMRHCLAGTGCRRSFDQSDNYRTTGLRRPRRRGVGLCYGVGIQTLKGNSLIVFVFS